MELRQLKYFAKTAEHMSFTKAAEELFIAQPAISQQIATLEEELGVLLFSREKRKIKLTEAGEAFLRGANKILREAEATVEASIKAYKGELSKLAIGFIGPPVFHFLPQLISEFRKAHPLIHISIYEMSAKQQIEALQKGEIDISFGRPFDKDLSPSIESKFVYQDIFLCVLPKEHSLTSKKRISAKDLSKEKLILLKEELDPRLNKKVMSFFDREEIPEIYFKAKEVQTILTMVASESGVAIVPQCASQLYNPGVIYLPMSPKSIKTELCIHWNAKKNSQAINYFLKKFSRFSSDYKINSNFANNMV